jgi:hypothetical protein
MIISCTRQATQRRCGSYASLLGLSISVIGTAVLAIPSVVILFAAATGTASANPLRASRPEAFSADEPAKKTSDQPKDKDGGWTSLFDGKTLGKWRSTQFGGEGEVTVEEGVVLLPTGDDMTGITWRGEPPARMNYELELEARRVDGNDFFCGLTFPVGKDYCSLICGGWGGGVTGLSSLDGNDASRNETSQWINYEKGRWYRVRLRVTEHRIEAWLDNKQIVDCDTTDRKIGIRGEVDPSKPLGISTWRTTGAIRNIRFRKIDAGKPPGEAEQKK